MVQADGPIGRYIEQQDEATLHPQQVEAPVTPPVEAPAEPPADE